MMKKKTAVLPLTRKNGRPRKDGELSARAVELVGASTGPDDEALKPHQVAAWLGVPESSVKLLTNRGQLKCTGVAWSRSYRRGDVLKFLRTIAAEYELLLKKELEAARERAADLERQWKEFAQLQRGGGREARAA